MDKANEKYRKNKVSIQFFTNKDLKREFQVTCVERGLKMKDVLERLIIDFNRKYETKPLR